ncbi:hypothetical protein CLV46_0994 [Diaminobutyricimonas aerilata]|uniref:Uncharacterized protein n=1 Tax=Diaminobutyricimonas aerilata TaxID=1162967 RepID=A0A2M9CHP6_9MICO|nr:hypothetical protein [Diaminobutyricimonas aerilata]PJJ71446.1 hypothetical protein CLV46_0994 [Diaminobutyricimonas aerilata]
MTSTASARTAPAAPSLARRRPSDRFAGWAAVLAGVFSVVMGTSQLIFPQDEDPAIDPRTRVLLVLFSVILWAFAVIHFALARRARSSWPAWVASAGTVLLTVGTVTSAANGIDLEFFPIVAMVANALWFIGSIALAVSLLRARRLRASLAWPLILVPVLSIIGSQMGGGILVGAYLLPLAVALLRGKADRPSTGNARS